MDLTKYKNWLILQGLSENTISNYVNRMKKIAKVLDLNNLTEDSISNYLLGLTNQYSKSTINGYRDTLKSYLTFIKKDIPLIKHMKLDKTLPEIIEESVFLKTILPTVERTFRRPIKIKAVLYFMYYTGIRVSEVGGLSRKNIDLTNRIAKIYGKKGKEERLIFFSEKVKDMLNKYFIIEPEKKNAFNLTTGSIKMLFTRLNKKLPNIRFYPHLLRHSFSVHFLTKGGDLMTLKELLGHKSINSTIRYAGLNKKQLQNMYDKFIK